jgi:hypothetical protein
MHEPSHCAYIGPRAPRTYRLNNYLTALAGIVVTNNQAKGNLEGRLCQQISKRVSKNLRPRCRN